MLRVECGHLIPSILIFLSRVSWTAIKKCQMQSKQFNSASQIACGREVIDRGYRSEGSLTPKKVSINFTALPFVQQHKHFVQPPWRSMACTHRPPIRGAGAGFGGYTAQQIRILTPTCEKHIACSVDSWSNGVVARSILHWNIGERH